MNKFQNSFRSIIWIIVMNKAPTTIQIQISNTDNQFDVLYFTGIIFFYYTIQTSEVFCSNDIETPPKHDMNFPMFFNDSILWIASKPWQMFCRYVKKVRVLSHLTIVYYSSISLSICIFVNAKRDSKRFAFRECILRGRICLLCDRL